MTENFKSRNLKIELKPIGILHTPFKTKENMPIQPNGGLGIQGTLELFPEYIDGLKDLDGFSHIVVIFYFHKADKVNLQAKPFLDDEIRGIFSIRGPIRPNHIGLSTVKLIKINKNILTIENIDMLDGTPVLDIKPYVPSLDMVENVRIGWLEGKDKLFQTKKSDDRF